MPTPLRMPQTLESDLRLAQFIPLKRVRTLAKAISIYEVVGLTGEVRPAGEDEHAYVTVEGLGLFIYAAE
jgi:hypothetical protein